MSTNDAAKVTDSVHVELQPHGQAGTMPEPAEGQLPPIPERPEDGASPATWAEYVVALGLHPDAAAELKRDDLAELATRLGG